MKKFLRIAAWVLLIAGIFILTGFINHKMEDEKCREVIVTIEDLNRFGFISEGDIIDILNREFSTPISQKIKDIDTDAIEKRLNRHMAVEEADVYISVDRKLNIRLTQRKPILRVFTDSSSFYIDHNGRSMPLSNKYTALVPVANGDIDLIYDSLINQTNRSQQTMDSTVIPSLYFDLYELSQFLDRHEFWKAQIEQVYVNKQSEFELIPRVGNHSIVLGGVDGLERKFQKLMWFYEKGLSKTGWNEYKSINLKFKDQVVCTKRY